MGKLFSGLFQKMGRKIGTAVAGMLGSFLAMYVFKDNPEMAMEVAKNITYLAMTAIGLQGAADTFGGKEYQALRDQSKKK